MISDLFDVFIKVCYRAVQGTTVELYVLSFHKEAIFDKRAIDCFVTLSSKI